jgi:uncharacterized protein (TIGR03067 family)
LKIPHVGGSETFVLAYPAGAETSGGLVLMLDGSVRQMAAPEVQTFVAEAASRSAGASALSIGGAAISDRDLMQGKWQVASVVAEGVATPEIGEVVLSISGDQVTSPMPGGPGGSESKTFVLHPDTLPKRIVFSDGTSAIYELTRDTLRLCSPIQPLGPLPTTFRAQAGDGTVLMELVRMQ